MKVSFYRNGISVVAVLCIMSMQGAARSPQRDKGAQTSTERSIGKKLNQEGIPNFGEVTPTLYRGGLLNNTGIKALKKLGVNVVVDTRSDNRGEKKEVEKLGMKYVAIPWHCPWPHDEVFAKFLKVVHDNSGRKIFVHCRLGDDRTGMMVAAYRMADQGWSADEAMNEMKAFGFTPAHRFICPGLAAYEQHFPERLNKDASFAEERARHSANAKAP